MFDVDVIKSINLKHIALLRSKRMEPKLLAYNNIFNIEKRWKNLLQYYCECAQHFKLHKYDILKEYYYTVDGIGILST